jgi:hypothetical protein
MSGKVELKKEDYERLREFEERILSLKESGVTYHRDSKMEAQIKKEVLFERFGSKKTDWALEKLNINYLDLSEQEIYIEIYTFLDTLK